MSAIRIKKEEFELMSNKDVAVLILENSKRPKSTADLFKKIIKLGNLPEKVFEEKVGDFYTVLATSKEFVQLDDGRVSIWSAEPTTLTNYAWAAKTHSRRCLG